MEDRMEQRKFQSWEDLCVFLDVWCEEKKVKFTIRQAEALTEEDIRQYPGGTKRAWALKYSSVHLACSSCASKSCSAFILLKLCPEEDKLIVTGINLHHNHDLPDMDVSLQIKRCRVTYPARLPAQMANDISWKFLEPSDLKRLLGLRSAVFEERTHVLKELHALFDSDPDAKVKLVFLEGKLLIKSIFLMTSNMQHIAQKFPGYLFVDYISSVCPGFDFYAVFCEEQSLVWKVCAYCFVKKGTADTLRFVLVSILQSIPTMKIQVKQITVNPEILDILDLQVLIPHASVRYCRPLLLEILYCKISYLDATAKAQVKNILHVLVHTLLPKAYDCHLYELKAVCPADVFQYYCETWHPRRKLWMEEDMRTPDADRATQASMFATHQALLERVGSSPTLHHCLQVVLNDSKQLWIITEPSQELNFRPDMIETTETKTSPEEEEKNNSYELSGESHPGKNKVSEEAIDEQLERREFQSWCDFRSFLDTWCLKKKMAFTIRQSVPLKDDHLSLDLQWPEVAKSLKYSSVNMGCSASKNCPAIINLKLGPRKDKLILVKTMLLHNHDALGDNTPPPFARSRLAPPPCLPTNITNTISKRFLERDDLSKLQQFHPAPFEDWAQILNQLDSLFISDPTAKVKLVFMENRLLVKNVFIMTSAMQDMVRCFPGYLYVDLLSRFGSLFDLYTVYCEDDKSEWRVCAKCIARKSRSSNLRFLMVSILQSIENLTNQVKYVTMNPEIQDPLDLEPLVPFASLRYCMPLVLEILYEKISQLGSNAEVQIKNFLHILAHTCSPSVYGRYLGELKAACPAEFFQYYYETWHPHRKMWIKKDSRSQITESNICTIVNYEHQALRAQVDASSSLYRCLQVILNGSTTALNTSSSSHLQAPPSALDTSAFSHQQASESTKEEELDQTEFSSWEDFCSFLDSWCEERKLMFTIRQSVTLTEEEIRQCPSGSVLAQCLKYSMVLLFCTRNSCPAFIKLQLCPHKEKLIISDTSFEHNHDLPATDLSPPLKRSKLVYTVGLPVQIANNISRKFLEPNDVITLQRFRSGAFEDRSQVLRELISLLLSDPDAKVKLVFEENKLQVKDIFLMTSSMQRIAQSFPRYLYIDFLSGFSRGFDLYAVLCEEENVGWTTCAYCIARKGTSDNLKFIVVSIFQSIPILNSQVKHVTVSPEIEDSLDIADLVPCASLRYCLPLVLDLLYDRISYMNLAEEAQIKDFLNVLAHTHSPTVYNQALNELKDACSAEAFQYYYETWHPRWKLWAEEYSNTPDAQSRESSISAFVKVKHQVLAAQMGISPSLHRCLQVVLDDSKTTLRITDPSQGCPSGPAVSPAIIQQADAVQVEERLKQNKFESWEDLCIFLDTWCKENKVELNIRQSEALTEEKIRQYPGGIERARALKYSSVHLDCSSCISNSCPAFVQLKLCPEEDKLIVADTNLHHNHNALGTDVPLQVKRSRGKHPLRSPASIANDISCKFLEPSDLKELLNLHSTVFEERTHVLKELDALLNSDPDAKVKLVFFEDKLLIKSIFLMTSSMQNVAQEFPGHLFVDFISSFIPGYDFYAVFCEEEGLAWKACAWCFARKGTADTLRFIMVSILQSIPTIKVQAKQILVNPEILDTSDLEVFIPYASVRYCMPLVLEILYQKVSHLDTSTVAQVKNILHIMCNAPSLVVYNQYLDELKAVCPAEVFQYYHEIWHSRRKMWMKKDNWTQDAESSIGVSLHAIHQALLDQAGCPPSLHHCLQVILSNSKPLLTITEPSQQFSSRPHMSSSVMKETDETTTSPEEEEKDESSFHLSGESRPSENQVSEEQLERSEFHSWEDFRFYLDTWCLKKKTMFTIQQSVPLKNDHLSLDPQWSELAKSMKYSSVIMSCSASKSCPAVIRLKLNPQKDKLILDKAMFHHNHNILEDNLLPPVTRSRLSTHPCFPAKITNDISRKFLERNDLIKLQRFHPAQFEDRTQILNELDALLISDPGVKIKLVFMENRLLVRNIFIMTSHMQDMIQRCPEYLYVDLLTHFGSHVDLYTVYCEDDNSEWKVCAMCIAQKGMSANLRFLMVSILQSIQNLSSQVKYVTLNPEIRESLDLKQLLPFSSLRYCMPLVLEMLYEKISLSGSTAETRIKRFLHVLAHTCSRNVYSRYLKKLKTACSPEFFYYYYEIWHPHRKMWIRKDNRSEIAESNMCTVMKSKHQALRAQVNASSSLYHCLQVVLNDNMTALNATSSPCLQDESPVLETFLTDTPQQACESMREEELDQTEFSSWVDFCLFLDSWCEERKLLFTVRQSRPLTKEEISQCPLGPVLAQCLKYSMVQLFCTRKSCPAFIKLQLCSQKEKLIVSNTSFQHNHDLPETDLSPPLKRSRLVSTVGLPVQITNNISRKFLKPYDLNTLQRFLSGAVEDRSQVLKKLDSFFLSDPNAKVKLVFEENKLQVKDIFLMTSSMQQITRCFPRYLYIDLLSSCSPGFDLYAVLCEEENVGWATCAYCIAKKGISDNLKFIVVSIFQSIPILNSQVKHVTVSPEIQDPLDIEDLVPCASLRYCLPLVLDFLYDKMSHMNSTEEAQIKDFLYILAHTHSPTVYNQALNELKDACSAEAFQYYYETWHSRRKLWVNEYNSTPDTESSISVYVKLKHQALTAQMGASPSLLRCLQVVLNDSKTTSPITGPAHGCPSGPAMSPAVIQQKSDDPAAPLDNEETEVSLPERCSDSYAPTNEVGEAPMEEQLEQSEFQSWEDFCCFLDDWCEERKLTFAIRRSVTLTEEDISQYPWGPEVAKSLKYSIVYMGCSIFTKRKNCPAVIKLRLSPQKDKLIITKAILHHNHDLPETAIPFERKHCRLMAPIDLPTRIANDISKKFLEHNDLRRLQRFRSYDFEDQAQVLTELVSLFISDPGAKVKLVFVEDKTLVKNIFLMTSYMQDIDHRFTGHLYVDLQTDFSPGFALYTMFCEKEGLGWKVCAYCLARKNTSDILRFLMVSLLQSIPSLSVSVKYLTLSPEIEDPLDLEALMPYASVRYCLPLVLELLYSKISHLDSIVQAHIKNLLHNVAYTLSPEIYSHSLTDLIAICPADVFQYYYDVWHPRKKLWVKGQSKTQVTENIICTFVKVKHLALMGQIGTSSSLHRCLQVVLSDSSLAMEGNETFITQEAAAAMDTAPTGSKPAGDSSGELKGREFWNWTEFCKFFDSWCAERKAMYKIELATAVDVVGDQVWPEGIKYIFVQLVCQKASTDVPHLRTPVPGDVVCPCSSSISLQATQDRTRLSIVQADLEHNHDLDAWEFEAFSSHFCLTKASHNAQLSSSISQHFLTPWDLQQLLAKCDTLEPALIDLLQELEGLFLLDPACQVRLVFQPNTFEVDSLFLITSHSRSLLQCYPSMLFLGRSLAVNDTFDLYTVLCEDAASLGRECAYFITRKENPAPIRLLVAFLIQSMPEIRSLTERIILRADLQDLDLIRELLPSCCVRMSQTHALHVLYMKLAMEDLSVQPKLKKLVNSVVHSSSPVLYNFSLQELEAAAPPGFLHYFLETWHRRKEDWAECWGHRMRNGRFLEFAAWKLEELLSTLSFPSLLATCIQTLLKVVEKMAKEEVEEKVAQMLPTTADEELLMPTCPMSAAEGSSIPYPTSPQLMPEAAIRQEAADSCLLPDPVSPPLIPESVIEQDVVERCLLPDPAPRPRMPAGVIKQDASENYPLPDPASSPVMLENFIEQDATESYPLPDLASPTFMTEGTIKQEDVEFPLPVASKANLPSLVVTAENLLESVTYETANMPTGVTNAAENISTAVMDTSLCTDLKLEMQESFSDGNLPIMGYCPPSIFSPPMRSIGFKHQLKDQTADLKGREFFSWMDFRLFFDVWCQKNKALYRIKTSTPLDKFKTSRAHSPELVATLKYGFVRLACKHAFAMQSTPRKSAWETPPCPSNIILRAGPFGDRLLITEAELDHNHQLSEEEVTKYFQRFKLKSKQNLLLGMTSSISKQFLVVQDLQKMVEYSSGEEPILQDLLKELTALFSLDSRAKVKLIFCPDSIAVDGVFMMTSRMKCLFQRFPSILYLHQSMSVNEDFNLYTVLCEDEESMGCECAYFVARKESQTPIRFMVVSLLQCMPDVIKPQIQSVIIDAGFKELDLIRALLPKRTVVMSQTYALETLYSRVAQEDLSVQETMRNIIHNLAYAHSPDVYQRNLRELEAVSLVDFLQYFLENWHYRKEIWVACWGLPQPKRSRFSNHMRSHQEKLAQVLSPAVTLAACIGGLLCLQSLKMLTATLEEEKISNLYQSVCSTANLKLIQEEISLTKQGTYEIREHARGFVLSDNISDFFINRTMSKCSCSIYSSSLLPCRHLFATRLWTGEAIFDHKLIQEQ